MRWLEVRRHSFTKKGDERGHGSHLSREGVAEARSVGGAIGPVNYVLVSPAPRTSETAIAMGYAVDEIADVGEGDGPGVAHHAQWDWKLPFVQYRRLLAEDDALAGFARRELDRWRRALERVEEGQVVLVIGHGGSIEPTLVAALPDADHAAWGEPFAHLDGVRLSYDDGEFVEVRFSRAGDF